MTKAIGIPALLILIATWIYFLVGYFTGWQLPAVPHTVVLIVAIAAGLGTVLWLFRESIRL